jgi:predicted nucleic-acid-binding Zn-ribbon protein
MEKQVYSCMKCKGTEYKAGELRTTGSGLSRFFNIQNQKYATVSCTACGYTELYRRDSSGVGNIIDFFGN